jgi:aryl-alcohol dehydrogenase-like predicted oxidoreductase
MMEVNRLQIHRLDRGAPKKEIMRALNDVIEKGWVRYIGASSMAAWEFQQLQVSSFLLNITHLTQQKANKKTREAH